MKQQISSTKNEIVELRDSLEQRVSADGPKVLYAPTYRLHNMLAKLGEDMNREQTRCSDLEFVLRKSLE